MELTAIFSIFSIDSTYIFALDLPRQSPLYPQEMIHASSSMGGRTVLDLELRTQLNKAITDVVTQLRRRHVSGGGVRTGNSQAAASLERLGKFLFNYLVPPALQEGLRELPLKMPILLTTNDMGMPWELLHDGSQYLALKHPIGRRLWSTAALSAESIPKPSHRSFLFIANPTEDLAEADLEVEQLMDLFEPEFIAGAEDEFLARSRATKWELLQALAKGYDLIHYSGHAEAGRLLLADGELTTGEIQKTLQGQPFVFLNACWSVRESKPSNESQFDSSVLTIRSLAEAFIMGGAVGFIGTLWQVFDQSSRSFAEWFYTLVRKGVSVGEALRRTRKEMYEAQPDDPIWASFVFYGDPTLTLASAHPENRQVTVLVARLGGLLPLFERLGLETASRLRAQVLDLFRQLAQRYAGQFYVSSTTLFKVHFGVPMAHGSAATYAIYTALDMIRQLNALMASMPANKRHTRSTPLTLHVGISTGRVLYRPLPGGTYQIIGVVEDVAAALAAGAEAGQIMVDQATSQSARAKVKFQERKTLFSRSKRVTDELAEMIPHRVVKAKGQLALTSQLVGREEEMGQLRRLWRKTKRGAGCVVAIKGEPGVGKSRLVQALREEIEARLRALRNDTLLSKKDNQHWISVACEISDKSQSYSLLGQVVRGLASIEPHDKEPAQRRALTQVVRQAIRGQGTQADARQQEGLSLLGRMIGVPFPMAEIDNLDPQQRQNMLEQLMIDVIKSHALRQQPLILALEDLHFADEASLTILNKVVKSVGRMRRVMLLATYRPQEWEAPHEWERLRHYDKIWLDDLPSDVQQELLANLLWEAELPEEVGKAILKQTGGHPLFIEEYILFLQENNFLIHPDEQWQLAADLSQLPPLNKVEAVIQARFNRLDEEKRTVLHSAAVIGQRFEVEALTSVQDKTIEESLNQHLDTLTDQHFIEEEDNWQEEDEAWDEDDLVGDGPPPQNWGGLRGGGEEWHHLLFYAFRHGLVHQVAYQLFSESFRQSLHRLVAEALMRLYGDKADTYRLAHHYYHSSERVKAIHYSLQAANSDVDKWANQTALEWYERALEKLRSFEHKAPSQKEQENGATAEQLISWQVEALAEQAEVLATIGKSSQAITGYEQALALACSDTFPVSRRASLYHKLAIVHHDQGQYDLAQEALNKGLEALGRRASPSAGRLHAYIGFIHFRRGRFADGLASCNQGIAMMQDTANIRELARAYNIQGILMRRVGESEKALAAYKQSIALYEQAQYLPGQERASYNRACLYKDLGRWDDALHSFEQSSAQSERMGSVQRQAAALNGQGEIYRRQGKLDQAINAYSQAEQLFKELGSEEFQATSLMNLGASYLKKGVQASARSCLTKSQQIFQRTGANEDLPEILRYLAELELLSEQATEALRLAQEAVDLALQQGHKLEEGQTKRTLGQVYRQLGELEEANQQLSESLTMLEERHIPYEEGLTLVELARLRNAQAGAGGDSSTLREEAIAYLERAIAIFDQLGAALELKRAQEIRRQRRPSPP